MARFMVCHPPPPLFHPRVVIFDLLLIILSEKELASAANLTQAQLEQYYAFMSQKVMVRLGWVLRVMGMCG